MLIEIEKIYPNAFGGTDIRINIGSWSEIIGCNKDGGVHKSEPMPPVLMAHLKKKIPNIHWIR